MGRRDALGGGQERREGAEGRKGALLGNGVLAFEGLASLCCKPETVCGGWGPGRFGRYIVVAI